MNVASMGPHIVVPKQDKSLDPVNLESRPDAVSAITDDEPVGGENDGPVKRETSSTRLLDLIQEAQKRKLIRSKGDRRKKRAAAAYRRQKDEQSAHPVMGTLLNAVR